MECFAVDKSLYDISDSDINLKELWDPDFGTPMGDAFGGDQDWANLLDQQPIILNDRMFTDAVQSPRIQSEHSYSLSASDDLPGSPMSIHEKYNTCKLEDFGKDLESECFPAIPMSTATGGPAEVHIKQEPLSAPSSPQASAVSSSPFSCYNNPSSPPLVSSSTQLHPHVAQQTQQHPSQNNHFHHFNRSCSSAGSGSSSGGLVTHTGQPPLKQPTIVLATNRSAQKNCRQMFSTKVKMETSSGEMHGFQLPPTPPSSNSSDSEGSLSPLYSRQPSSPPALSPPNCPSSLSSSTRKHGPQTRMLTSSNCNQLSNGIIPSSSSPPLSSSSSYKNSACTTTSLISSQPKGATGMLMLTEEEKRTLIAEGYPIPTRLPLTKAEEKSLKKIRRKIKNKISAQESRRKKKEYMDALEKKVENLAYENGEYRRKVDTLEDNNQSLLMQLQELQAMLGESPNKISRTVFTQTSSSTWPKRSLKCIKS